MEPTRWQVERAYQRIRDDYADWIAGRPPQRDPTIIHPETAQREWPTGYGTHDWPFTRTNGRLRRTQLHESTFLEQEAGRVLSRLGPLHDEQMWIAVFIATHPNIPDSARPALCDRILDQAEQDLGVIPPDPGQVFHLNMRWFAEEGWYAVELILDSPHTPHEARSRALLTLATATPPNRPQEHYPRKGHR